MLNDRSVGQLILYKRNLCRSSNHWLISYYEIRLVNCETRKFEEKIKEKKTTPN